MAFAKRPFLTNIDPSLVRSRGQQGIKRISWCFRCNISEEESISAQADELCGKLIDVCNIYAFQAESAPTTGYKHFQGYFELQNKNRFEWIQKHIRKFEYLSERRAKTAKQAWDYATKTDTRIEGPWLLGEPTAAESGANKVTEQFVRAIQKGFTDKQLLEEFPSCFARMPHVPSQIRHVDDPVRTVDLKVYVLYGPPGTGKSRMAKEKWPGIYTVPFSRSGLWLTKKGDMRKIVLFEDFNGELPLKQFNRLIDRYPEEVEYKGGHVWWLPEIVIITTNVLPSQWYPQDDRQDVLGQIYRRITGCYDFTGVKMEDRDKIIPIPVEDLVRRYPEQTTNNKRKRKPKDEYYMMKVERLKAAPMMGLVQQTCPPQKKQKVEPPMQSNKPAYRWDPVTKMVVPATGYVEQTKIMMDPVPIVATPCPPVYSIYKGLANRSTMTQDLLMDGYQ